MSTRALCESLAQALLARGWMLATAESCTGGLIAAACTDLGGSSNWFERGFVTYSDAAKTELLGVDAALIAGHGAVSEVVARAMSSLRKPSNQSMASSFAAVQGQTSSSSSRRSACSTVAARMAARSPSKRCTSLLSPPST